MINILGAEFLPSNSTGNIWQSIELIRPQSESRMIFCLFGFMETTPGDFREDIPHKDTNMWVNENNLYSHISIDVRSVDTFKPVDGCSILTQMLGGRPNG